MTTPEERFLSIRWGLEALVAIQADLTYDPEHRLRASTIAVDYPSDDDLRGHLAQEQGPIPHRWLAAIDQASALFRDLRGKPQGSDETRHLLRYVDRHYPIAGEAAKHMSDPIIQRVFGPWITPDQAAP